MKDTNYLCSSDLLKHMCRYIGAMQCAGHKNIRRSAEKNGSLTSEPFLEVYSGFFVRCKNVVLWISAGHVVDKIVRPASYDRTIVQTRLLDSFHIDNPCEHTIPVDLKDIHAWWIDNDHLGVDYGAIVLKPHICRLILRNGVELLSDVHVAENDEFFESYGLLGFPDIATDVKIKRHGSQIESRIKFGTPLLPLIPTEKPGSARGTKLEKRYFKIEPHVTSLYGRQFEIDDVHGMSGGPVFGFRKTERGICYRLVGIQSTQWESCKILGVCPFGNFFKYLSQQLEKMASGAGRVPPPTAS